MKKILTLLIGIVFSITIINAQVPYKFSFKATIVNKNGAIVANKTVGVMIKILPDGYEEPFTTTTNQNGQIDIIIGGGISDLSSIIWSTGEHFLEVWVDVKGGQAYVLMSTTQLLSVPYALFAGSVDFSNLLNKPNLFDGQWSSLNGTPSSASGDGILDAVTTSGDQDISGNKTFNDDIIPNGKIVANGNITIESTDNNVIVLAGASKVTISPSGGVTIESNNITVAATGDLKLSGENVEISGVNVDIKAANVSLVGSVKTSIFAPTLQLMGAISTSLTGGITQILSFGLTKIQGAIVTIN